MKKYLKYIDKKLFIATIILFVFGSVMVFSASSVSSIVDGLSAAVYFKRQILFLFIGFIWFNVIIRVPTNKYKRLIYPMLIAVVSLLLVALFYSVAINQTYGWIRVGPFGIQPSEFAKIAMIIYLSIFYGQATSEELSNNKRNFFSLLIIGAITFIIISQNDYGTAAILLTLSFFLFLISNVSKKFKTRIILTGAILMSTVIFLVATDSLKIISKDKLARFDIHDPCGRYLDEGNQVCNSIIAINGGGLFGKGLGNSTQKYLYLPESHTDFIFAILVEELGFIFGIILILFYIFVLTRIVLAGKRSKNDSHALMCYGISFYIFLHIIVNLGGVMGIIPITGVPLPFMSYGGSFTVSLVTALSIVQRINYENNKNI